MTSQSHSLSMQPVRTVAIKPKTKKCKQCGTEFTPERPAFYERSKFCSLKCSGAFHFRQEKRVCKNCGKEFMFKPSQLNAYKGAGQYCSKVCHGKHKIEVNAHKPIKDRYGRSHRKADIEWAAAVKEKYQNICQRCFRHFPVIHAHHIALRSHRPDLKHDASNGITLCNSCHSWVHHHPKLAKEMGLISSEYKKEVKK